MDKAHKALKGFFEANRVFLASRDEINATLINTFLGVALYGHERDDKEPLTIKELSEKVSLPYTTVSRHLRYLGDFERTGVEGMGLVKTDIYILNRRQKIVSLTTKGKGVRDRLLFSLGVDSSGEE
ncbi:hypothetical protein [Roseibium sediminis]|uniref:hypothetical protein n=1 Tax=Roseibium sediminis TaxID=1775174 RepID=UPI00123D8807|nr:hypothetical protein [Roseibium sediminis]